MRLTVYSKKRMVQLAMRRGRILNITLRGHTMTTKLVAPDGSGTRNKDGSLFRKKAIAEMDTVYIAFKTAVVKCLMAKEGPTHTAHELYAMSETLPEQLRDALSVSINFAGVGKNKGEFA